MKRILICGLTDTYGGMEAYVMEIFRHCDKSRVQFDFLFFEHQKVSYLDEIKMLGGGIIVLPLLKRHPFSYYKSLSRIFVKKKYHAVYYQCNHKLKYLRILSSARKNGVPVRAVHSHNSKDETISFFDRIIEKYVGSGFDKEVNKCLACSYDAGKWMFGNRQFEVVHNPVDVNEFRYDPVKRNEIRDELGITDELVIGTVGRLVAAKNSLFMTDVFREIIKRKNAVFIHIGDGDLKEKMVIEIKRKGLEDKYLLLGRKEKVSEYLSAMDVFILPSVYEGFPIALIEAQSNGLKCVASDNIDRNCNIIDDVRFVSLDRSPEEWADIIINSSDYIRTDRSYDIMDRGFDISSVVNDIYRIFDL